MNLYSHYKHYIKYSNISCLETDPYQFSKKYGIFQHI